MQRIITHISPYEAGMLITLVTNLGRLAALDRHTSTSMSSPCTRRLYGGTPVGAGGPNTSPVGILNLAPCQGQATSSPAMTPSASESEEHTSELQSLRHLVCRLLL